MSETERNQIKGALLKCAEENENRPTYTGYVVVSSVCRSAAERITELEEGYKEIKRRLMNTKYSDKATRMDDALDFIDEQLGEE